MCRYTISAETLRAAQALRVLKQASSVETGLRKLYTGGTASSSSQQYPTQLLGWVSISRASCTWQTSKADFQPR